MEGRNTSTVESLLGNDTIVSPDAFNASGETPLHIAARHEFLHIVNLLLEYGANKRTTAPEFPYPMNAMNYAVIAGKKKLPFNCIMTGPTLNKICLQHIVQPS